MCVQKGIIFIFLNQKEVAGGWLSLSRAFALSYALLITHRREVIITTVSVMKFKIHFAKD